MWPGRDQIARTRCQVYQTRVSMHLLVRVSVDCGGVTPQAPWKNLGQLCAALYMILPCPPPVNDGAAEEPARYAPDTWVLCSLCAVILESAGSHAVCLACTRALYLVCTVWDWICFSYVLEDVAITPCFWRRSVIYYTMLRSPVCHSFLKGKTLIEEKKCAAISNPVFLGGGGGRKVRYRELWKCIHYFLVTDTDIFLIYGMCHLRFILLSTQQMGWQFSFPHTTK